MIRFPDRVRISTYSHKYPEWHQIPQSQNEAYVGMRNILSICHPQMLLVRDMEGNPLC